MLLIAATVDAAADAAGIDVAAAAQDVGAMAAPVCNMWQSCLGCAYSKQPD